MIALDYLNHGYYSDFNHFQQLFTDLWSENIECFESEKFRVSRAVLVTDLRIIVMGSSLHSILAIDAVELIVFPD